MDFHHRLDDVSRTAGITDAPSGHGKGLGESVQKERPFLHPRKCGDGVMWQLIVGELAIDFIGQDDEIMLHGEGSNFFEFLQRHDSTGGIRREIQHQHAGLQRDSLLKIRGFE